MTSAQCQQTAEDWNKNGVSLADQDKFDDALKAFDKAIRLGSLWTVMSSDQHNELLGLLNRIKAKVLSSSEVLLGQEAYPVEVK